MRLHDIYTPRGMWIRRGGAEPANKGVKVLVNHIEL
jgi:hypothetical protein